jgi:hypothetical protein
MFKLYLRNPTTDKMEMSFVETAKEAEAIVLKAWPECRVSLIGEVIITREREVEGRHGPVMVYNPICVARVEFTDLA